MDPYTKSEQKEIARLRKLGRDDSYINGWMKKCRGTNNVPSVKPRSKPMATRKKTGKKAPAKKAAKKTPGKKPAAKPGRKAGEFKIGDTLTAVTGQDEKFYQKFPRYKAYQLLCKKGTMKTKAFIDAVEKMEGVKTRGQALGILTKLLKKGCAKASNSK